MLGKSKVLLLSICLGIFPGSLVADDKINDPKVISSLEWGEVLFYYFSGYKMEALVRLYARESRNGLNPHQPEADLLAAGLLLDLGLASKAQLRLENISNQNLTAELKSRLALIMARVYFKGQNFKLSKYWLETIDVRYLEDYELAHKKMMHAQLLFNERNFTAAAEQLKDIEDKGNLQLYASYNQGLSLLRLDNEALQIEGRLLLESVSSIVPIDQEQYALTDQAKLTLGLDDINAGRPEQARQQFINVRLDGLVSKDALLLLGWTYAQTEEFAKALTYWKKLATNNEIFEPTVQESWLAVPYAYQQLGDLQKAVQGYETAVLLQTDALNQLSIMLEDKRWRALLTENITGDAQVNNLPKGFRRQLIANPKFYSYLKEWQDLDNFQRKVKKNLEILPVLQIVLKENELRYLQKSEIVKQQLAMNNPQQFIEKQALLQAQFEEQKSKVIAEAILSKEDYNYWLKLQSIHSIIGRLPNEVGEEKIEKFRRVEGVAQWNFHRQRDVNTWAVENSLNKLAESITELTTREQHLEELADKPRQSSEGNLARVSELALRGKNITQQVINLQMELEQAMSTEFLYFVELRQLALKDLAEQANLALARLRFRAIKESLTND